MARHRPPPVPSAISLKPRQQQLDDLLSQYEWNLESWESLESFSQACIYIFSLAGKNQTEGKSIFPTKSLIPFLLTPSLSHCAQPLLCVSALLQMQPRSGLHRTFCSGIGELRQVSSLVSDCWVSAQRRSWARYTASLVLSVLGFDTLWCLPNNSIELPYSSKYYS